LESVFSTLKTVIIATDGEPVQANLILSLTQCGYEIVATTSIRHDFLEKVQSLKPQLALASLDQASDVIFHTLQKVIALRTTAIVILMKEWDTLLAKKAMEIGVSGYMLQTLDPAHTSATLESSWHHFQKLISLQDNLDARKLLEKAKGVLIREYFLTEEDAHQRILKMSQDQSIPLKDICQSILSGNRPIINDKLKK
jgi:two-component system, response regulator PdtaR